MHSLKALKSWFELSVLVLHCVANSGLLFSPHIDEQYCENLKFDAR